MKNKILHSVFSIFVSIVIILPFAIQTLHALEGHEHRVCNAKDVKHFHQQEVNCSIYHQIIEQNSIDFLTEFNLEIPLFFSDNPVSFYQSLHGIDLQLKPSRAPPYFIV